MDAFLDMFFTPSPICCGGVVLDYFSMLMIINELLPKQDVAETYFSVLRVWCMDLHLLEYTFSFFCLSDNRLLKFHFATFPFYCCVEYL